MAWLARLDAKAARWSLPSRVTYGVLKWTLAGLGAWAWIALWWQRHPALGLAQFGIVGYLLWRECRPHLGRQRADDLTRD